MNKFLSAIARTPKRLFEVAKRSPKRTAAITMIASAVVIPAALLAFGPSRLTFTMAAPAPYVTFDSITDNPSVGDERNFVRIRDTSTTADYSDNVAITPGKTYEVEMYYHNDASTNLNASGVGVAKNATARISMPATVNASSTATITGYLGASNANPTSVWDSATGTTSSTGAVALRYVAGSAKFTSNGKINGQTVPDSLFTTGTNLGYNAQDGTLPGCLQYAGYITFEFTAVQPNFSVVKQVSVDGGKTFGTTETATPGSTVTYRIEYANTGSVEMDNVIDKDTLPAGVTYVPNSSYYASANTGGVYKAIPDGVTTVGFNTGGFMPASNSYLQFEAKVADNNSLATCGNNSLVNTATVYNTANGAKSATATINVTKTCTAPTPVYSCNGLTATLVSGTKYSFTPSASASNGASIVNYIYNFGDGTTTTSTTNAAVTHTYPSITANYNVTLSVTVNVNGTDKVVTNPYCDTTVAVKVTPPPTPVYTCNTLSASLVSGTEYSFTPNVTATNGATIVNYIYDFGDGTKVTETTAASVTHTYPATTANYQAQLSATVIANGTTYVISGTSCEAKISIVVTPPATPVYDCNALSKSLVSGSEYSFTPNTTASNGATVVSYSYSFGDGTSTTSTTASPVTHTYPTTGGTYTAALSVTFNVNGATKVVTNPYCETTVTIAPPAAVYTCDALTATLVSGTEYSFTPSATATNGAKIANYIYTFGDGTTSTQTTAAAVTHTYPTTSASYTANLSVTVDVNGVNTVVTGSKCAAVITVTQTTPPVTPTTPTTPTELPHTGAALNLGTFLGLGALIASVGYYVNSRRALLGR